MNKPINKKTENKNISDLFKTQPELKKYINSLLGSLGLITLIWGGGAYFNNLSNKIEHNKNDIDVIKTEISTLKSDVENDIIELNDLNNKTWNNKLIIYFNHSNDMDMVKTLLEMEDNKYEYNVKRITNDIDKKPTN